MAHAIQIDGIAVQRNCIIVAISGVTNACTVARGCDGDQLSTMTLQDTSTGEAEWLWAVSFRLQALFRALPEPGAAAAAALLHATSCAQVFEVLAYVHSAHRTGWLLLPSTRRQLGFLGIQHSIFDTLPCIGASGAVNATAVRETVEQLQRLHPGPHVPVAL